MRRPNDEVRLYTSESVIKYPGRFVRSLYKSVLEGKELAWIIAMRDIQAQHRQSVLGIFWIFILPLANTLTWIFLRSSGAVDVSETEIPYPVYVFTGTMIWSIFSESLLSPMIKVTANKSLLSKINFPREALILASIYHSAVGAIVKILLMLCGMILLGYDFLTLNFFFFPLGIISIILSGTALGLLLTPLALLYNDISKGLPIIMQFLMYFSPVVYAVPKKSWIASLIGYNPLTPLVVTARSWMTGNEIMELQQFFVVNFTLIPALLVALIIYRAAMPILIERMSS